MEHKYRGYTFRKPSDNEIHFEGKPIFSKLDTNTNNILWDNITGKNFEGEKPHYNKTTYEDYMENVILPICSNKINS